MPETTTQLAVDPICGMKVDPENAAGSSMWNGRNFYFCSHGCEVKFDSDPQKYAAGNAESSSCCSTKPHGH